MPVKYENQILATLRSAGLTNASLTIDATPHGRLPMLVADKGETRLSISRYIDAPFSGGIEAMVSELLAAAGIQDLPTPALKSPPKGTTP